MNAARSCQPIPAKRRPPYRERFNEIWFLRITAGTSKGKFVRAIDATGDPVVCYRNERDAQEAAADAAERSSIRCAPVRVHPRRSNTHAKR